MVPIIRGRVIMRRVTVLAAIATLALAFCASGQLSRDMMSSSRLSGNMANLGSQIIGTQNELPPASIGETQNEATSAYSKLPLIQNPAISKEIGSISEGQDKWWSDPDGSGKFYNNMLDRIFAFYSIAYDTSDIYPARIYCFDQSQETLVGVIIFYKDGANPPQNKIADTNSDGEGEIIILNYPLSRFNDIFNMLSTSWANSNNKYIRGHLCCDRDSKYGFLYLAYADL